MDSQPQPPAMENPPPPVAGAGAYPPGHPGGGPGWYPPPPPPKSFNPVPLIIGLVCGVPLLIAVPGIVAAIAIPLLLSSRVGAINEKARNTVRSVSAAEAAYFATNNKYGSLLDLRQGGFIDAQLASGNGGSEISVTVVAGEFSYTATATAHDGRTPYHTYSISQDGMINEDNADLSTDSSAGAAGDPAP